MAISRERRRVKEFFEIDEATRSLDAARRLDANYEVKGACLLTGGRRMEVLGLLVEDVGVRREAIRTLARTLARILPIP